MFMAFANSRMEDAALELVVLPHRSWKNFSRSTPLTLHRQLRLDRSQGVLGPDTVACLGQFSCGDKLTKSTDYSGPG